MKAGRWSLVVSVAVLGGCAVTDLWSGASLDLAKDRFAQTLPPHGAGLYRLRAR